MIDVTADPSAARDRRTARLAGVLYLLTFLTSIPTLVLYAPVRDHADFVLGAGATSTVTAGALLEVALAVACVGTAVVLFPVVRRYSWTAALGFLSARVVEAALILVGVLSMLTLLRLRQDLAGGGVTEGLPDDALLTGQVLRSAYDGSFLLGQSLMPVFNALCLAPALLRSGLVPRAIPLLGLVGAPLLLASDVAIVVGVYEAGTPLAGLAALPVAGWELALGTWLVVKGFRAPAEPRPALDVPATAGVAG